MTHLTRLTSDITQDITDLYVACIPSVYIRAVVRFKRASDVGAGVGSFRLCSHCRQFQTVLQIPFLRRAALIFAHGSVCYLQTTKCLSYAIKSCIKLVVLGL